MRRERRPAGRPSVVAQYVKLVPRSWIASPVRLVAVLTGFSSSVPLRLSPRSLARSARSRLLLSLRSSDRSLRSPLLQLPLRWPTLDREASISFDSVRDKNVMQLRKLNTAIFPVTYQDQFYTDALHSGDFTKLAYYNDICVGSIACRLEKKDGGNVRLYIMTLGVLAPYRRLGIGSKLLQNALDLCKEDPNIVEVYLHVQINNDEAIEFYRQFGFEITNTLKNYYKRIEPPHCHVLSKTLVSAGKSNGDS